MSFSRRLLVFLSCALVLTLLLAACGGGQVTAPPSPTATAKPASTQSDWSRMVALAKDEGKVSVYTSIGQDTRVAISQVMKAKYGVELEFTMGSSGDIVQKILTEKRGNLKIADIAFIGPGSITQLKTNGAFTPIDKLLAMPGVTDPGAWPDGRLPFLDKDKDILMISGGYLSYMILNGDLTKGNEITSVQDLLKPQIKGKIIMDDPTGPGSANNWLSFIIKYVMGPEKARGYFKQLAAQEPVLTRDARQLVEWVAKEKSIVGIGASQMQVYEFQKAGAPVVYANMVEGGLVHPGESCISVIADSPHPNATAVFVNWLLSSEGQAIFSKVFGKPGLRIGTPTEGLDPFSIPSTHDKVYYADEDFIALTLGDGLTIGKEVFGPLKK